HLHAVFLDEPADRARFVLEIAEHAGADRADLDAGRLQPFGDAVIAPGALVRDVLLRVEEARAIRASLDAVLAADTIGVVDEDYTVLGLKRRASGAHLHAGRMRAVVAQLGHEERLLHVRVLVAIGEAVCLFRARGRDVHRIGLAIDVRRVFTFQIDIALDPGAEVMRVERDIVFRLAGLDTAQAADALPGINPECPLVLGPVVPGNVRYRRRPRLRRRARRFGFACDRLGCDRHAGRSNGRAE